MLSEILERREKLIAVALLSWAALLNLRFFVSAGPLWRDEANSVSQACLPGWSRVLDSLQYDSFPILYPGILRAWTSVFSPGSDLALRTMGLLTGLALLISICLVCRLFGSRTPVVVLVLVGVDPIMISEACSIRPYGLTLVALLWAFASHGMCLTRPSWRWLLVASLSSVAAVQLSYSSAFFVAAFGLAAAGSAAWQGNLRLASRLTIPGAIAALTLLPYLPVLERAGSWVVLLHYRVDWTQFFAAYVKEHTVVQLLAWIIFLALACFAFSFRSRGGVTSQSGVAAARYAVSAAILGLVFQVLLVQFMEVPPFPRYFLPMLLFVGIALQLVLERRPHPTHAAFVILALLLTAWPGWTWLGLRRTNMDQVAQVLGREVRHGDLVVLSPWFLHPGFQRYYAGSADWITVPQLPPSPITRYDLFMKAMFRDDPVGGLSSRLSQTLGKGGRVWLLHQEIGYVPERGHPPEAPSQPSTVSGEDYVRYRSYWEREIWFLLRSCCRPQEFPVSGSRRVWEEERLQLTLWHPVGPAGEDGLKIQTK